MISKKQNAFSLMEILIVIVIIGILSAMVGPRIMKAMKKIKETQTRNTLSTLQAAIGEYYGDVRRYPSRLDDLLEQPAARGPQRGKWRGPYAKEENLEDAWGSPIEYNHPPVRFKREGDYQSFELISLGPDLEESDDDIHMGE